MVDVNKDRMNQLIEENTALRQQVKELQNMDRTYFKFLDHSHDAVTIFSLEKNILDGNKKLLRISGYTKNELVSMELPTLFPEAATEHSFKRMSALMQDQEIPTFTTQLHTKAGTLVPVEIGVTLIKNCYGKSVVFLGNIRDISKRLEMEEYIRQAEKMEAIGQLAGGIAHDFNNQLGVVMGNADLLREKVSNIPSLTRYADSIFTGIKHASDLTEKLLAFARKGKYLSVPVNIHGSILEVIALLNHSIQKNIQIKQEFNAAYSTVIGDPTQLQNALLNLGLNARDAMKEGGELQYSTKNITIDSTLSKKMTMPVKPGSYIQIDIRDTGEGIEEKLQKHIFEPFFTTKMQGQGTGMGLAAVYGSVKSHNGSIRFNTALGKGTEFSIFLPLVDEKSNDIKDTKVEQPIQLLKKISVFVIDDEKMICEMASGMLEDLGYSVSVCSHSYEAINYYRSSWKTIDLVIFDMIMPELSGKEIFLALYEINPDIKAILSSGYNINEEARSILEAGAVGFIHKPYMPTELAQIIARTCDTIKPTHLC